MSGPFHFSDHPPQRVAIVGDASLAAQCIDLAIERRVLGQRGRDRPRAGAGTRGGAWDPHRLGAG